MKILRISPSFASIEYPGSGLNAYYHSIHSSEENLILTEFKSATYKHVPSNVTIKAIKINNVSLGKPGKFKSYSIIRLAKKIYSTLIFFFKAKKDIDTFLPDIVHLYTPIHLITGLYCKIRFKSKLVVSLHGTDVLRISSSQFFKYLLRFFDSILLLSKKMKDDLAINHSDITYIGNGFDNTIFKLPETEKRKKIILTVGNLRWQKDHHTLIKAFSIFTKQNPDYKLIIIGDGDLKEELKELAFSQGVSKLIDFKGSLPPLEVAKFMQQSDFFILSSISEGSPKVILEAMSCGLPILSTSVGDIPNLVQESGMSCKAGDHLILSKAMSDFVDVLMKMNRKEISKIISFKSWQNVTKTLEHKYKKLIIQ